MYVKLMVNSKYNTYLLLGIRSSSVKVSIFESQTRISFASPKVERVAIVIVSEVLSDSSKIKLTSDST